MTIEINQEQPDPEADKVETTESTERTETTEKTEVTEQPAESDDDGA